ncbi:MAG TPA: hypothetical protein VGD49_05610 [Longimicrobiales bacterium]
MNDRQQDTDLRVRFDAQRRADASDTPSFVDMMARARAEADAAPALATRPFNFRRLVYVGTLAAAAAIAALIVIPRSSSNEDEFEQAVRAYRSSPALSAWQSPTDGLLDVPGSQLISTVPRVGAQ